MLGPSTGDRDRHLLIRARQKIRRPHANALTRGDVHAVVDDLARPLGDVILCDRRNHRGLFAQTHRLRGQAARGVHHRDCAHARERFLNAFEASDRGAELPPRGHLRAGAAHRELGHADVRRGQRNRAAGGETFHQHALAVADLFASTDDPFHRDGDVAAPVRAVLEPRVERSVPAADMHTRMRRRNQRAGDAGRIGIAQQNRPADDRGRARGTRGRGRSRSVRA